MRLIYIDEAGISNPKQEPYVVCAGAIVDADKKLVAVERHLDALVERHIPQDRREDFVFHAAEIFGGGGKVFDRAEWPLDRRLKIAADLAQIPKKFKIPIAFGWIERATFPTSFTIPPELVGKEAVFAHATAFVQCALFAEHWMRRNASNEVALLVVEDNAQARGLIKDIYRFHQNRFMERGLSERAKKHFPLRKLKEDPLFQNKRRSSVLQLADFCAYVFKRFLMNQNDERYLPFWKPMSGQVVAFDDL